jgi:hypothetical protein
MYSPAGQMFPHTTPPTTRSAATDAVVRAPSSRVLDPQPTATIIVTTNPFVLLAIRWSPPR